MPQSNLILNFDVNSFNGNVINCVRPDYEVRPTELKDLEKNTELFYASGIICRLGINFHRDLLRRFNRLRFIATVTTGLDHIDLNYCKQNEIEVLSLKGETEFLSHITATPELTWGLVLSLIRKIPDAHVSVKTGVWSRKQFFGHTLANKTLGILGFGRIGKIVGRYGYAFGMKVSAYDVVVDDYSEYPYSRLSMNSLLEQSDILSIHVPYDQTTKHLLGYDQLARLKRGAFLVNTSRGGVIDECALLHFLKNGHIAGVALDVLAAETDGTGISLSHPLIQFANQGGNIVFTPHIAGSTYEAMENTANFIAKKVLAFLSTIGD